MKSFLLFTVLFVSGCTALGLSNKFKDVQVGMTEQELKEYQTPLQTMQYENNKYISMKDGLLITKDQKVVATLAHEYDYEFDTTVDGVYTSNISNPVYFLKANSRTTDEKSAYFQKVKKIAQVFLKLKGVRTTENIDEANAILYIGYGITTQLTHTSGMYQGGMLISQHKETSYVRFLTLSASEKGKEGDNIPYSWEVKVDSTGSSNDIRVFLPAFFAATGTYWGQDTNGKKEVHITYSDIVMNLLRDPEKTVGAF